MTVLITRLIIPPSGRTQVVPAKGRVLSAQLQAATKLHESPNRRIGELSQRFHMATVNLSRAKDLDPQQ